MNNINFILFLRNGETSDRETLVGHTLVMFSLAKIKREKSCAPDTQQP